MHLSSKILGTMKYPYYTCSSLLHFYRICNGYAQLGHGITPTQLTFLFVTEYMNLNLNWTKWPDFGNNICYIWLSFSKPSVECKVYIIINIIFMTYLDLTLVIIICCKMNKSDFLYMMVWKIFFSQPITQWYLKWRSH